MFTFAVLPFPNIDPVLFSIGPFAIRWYALAYIVGIVFGIWYMKRLVSNPGLWAGTTPSATPKQIDDFFLLAMLGVVLGGRIGYLLFYGWTQILSDPLYILRVWEGGMSFHGGFFGVIIASYIYARRQRIGLDRLLDLGAAATPVGLGLGRLANFINGELYGRPTDMPWGVVFPMSVLNPGDLPVPRHPTQLYEAFLEGIVLFLVLRYFTHSRGSLKQPGLTAGVFLCGYGMARIIGEIFREWDYSLYFTTNYFSQGMVYSLPMVAAGAFLILRATRRHAVAA